jgi:hypothetical protein
VFPLLKIVDMTNSNSISDRLMPAIIEPIIVSQFLEDGGSFMITCLVDLFLSKSKNKKIMH